MSFQPWYGSHSGEVNQQTEPAAMGFKCVAHGCNQARPSPYNTVYCKDHLSSAQQLPRYISQPRPDTTNTRVESHIGTWELNPRMSAGNPHIEVTPIFPETQTPRYTNYEAGIDDMSGGRHVIFCGTHSKSYPVGEYLRHWREHHSNEVSALRDINPSMNLLRMNYPPQPSPTLPPMRTTPPPEQGKELTSSRPHGHYQEVLNLPANLPTHSGSQARVYQPMAPTPTQPEDAGFVTHHYPNASNKAPRTNQVYSNKRPNPHPQGPRQGSKQGPKQIRSHRPPAQANMPTTKRNVVIVDLTIEPSPPPPAVIPQAQRHHDPTEQVEKASQTPNVLAREPPQEPLNQKKRKLEPETPIPAMPPTPPIPPSIPPVPPVLTERDLRVASPPKTVVEEEEQRLPPSTTHITVSCEHPGNTALESRDIPGPTDEQSSVDSCDAGAIDACGVFSALRDEPSGTNQNESNSASFDSIAFDVSIYQQDEAGSPPPGVSLPNARSTPPIPQNSDRMLYLHINPLVHRPYTRSQEWSARKATEIHMRPRRKHWFGKAAERQRWVWSQIEANESRHPGESTRRDPQPWTYDRPLDYGDVPPEKLPQDVLDNPAWVKACAWHRETQQMEYLRRAERQRQAEQTRQYFRSLLNAPNIIQKASQQQSVPAIVERV